MTSTLAPVQNPISSNRRRTSGSPPTAKTLPLHPMPSLLRAQVSGEVHPLQAANPHAFCISGSVSRVYPRDRPLVLHPSADWPLRVTPEFTSLRNQRKYTSLRLSFNDNL